MGAVVFPEPDLGIEIISEALLHRQWRAILINGNDRRASAINADADDVGNIKGTFRLLCLHERLTDNAFATIEIVLRVLARHIRVTRIGQDAMHS